MTNGNDAANPCIESINHAGVVQITTSEAGLTKREYFAVMAMQGLLAHQFMQNVNDAANDAVAAADALIKELNKSS